MTSLNRLSPLAGPRFQSQLKSDTLSHISDATGINVTEALNQLSTTADTYADQLAGGIVTHFMAPNPGERLKSTRKFGTMLSRDSATINGHFNIQVKQGSYTNPYDEYTLRFHPTKPVGAHDPFLYWLNAVKGRFHTFAKTNYLSGLRSVFRGPLTDNRGATRAAKFVRHADYHPSTFESAMRTRLLVAPSLERPGILATENSYVTGLGARLPKLTVDLLHLQDPPAGSKAPPIVTERLIG